MLNWNQLLRPKTWDDIIAQKQVKSLIMSSLENDNLGQFIIFSGQSGTGKSCIAELIGSAIACDVNKTTPCGKCKHCLDLKNGDESIVRKFNMATMIGKQDVLTIITQVFDYETIAGKAVFILEEVDALTETQQRPFLEPLTSIPEDVTIIMCTAHYSNLIPELRNRAIHYRLETPDTSECVKFIQSICKKMGTTVPSEETATLFSDMCNNTPRTIISTLQMFANEKNLTEEMISNYFGIADTKVYIELMKYLSKNVSTVKFVEFLNNLKNFNTTARKIVKGIERFAITLLLQRSQPKPFKDYIPEQAKDLTELFDILTQEDIIKIIEGVIDIPKRAYSDEDSATLFLMKLKLSLTNRENKILADNLNLATQTKLEANKTAKRNIMLEDRLKRQQNLTVMNEGELKLFSSGVFSE